MSDAITRIVDPASLERAVNEGAAIIEIAAPLADLPSFRLPPGSRLRGGNPEAVLAFRAGQPGVVLSANSDVADIRLETDEAQIALGLADDTADLGKLSVTNVTTVGRVHLEASQALRGELQLENIRVERADARMAAHRPGGFGVEALLGAIAVYNHSRDPLSQWTLSARGLSCGSEDRPVRGSGVFIFGGWTIPLHADLSTAPAPDEAGGNIELRSLTTGDIHSDGGIPPGTGNLITAGVFVGSGVHALQVVNEGTTTTYGPNDMVLDNWGRVDAWTAKAPVSSHGASGIGFVNFGDMGTLRTEAAIETRGLGARGFNLYDGSLHHAVFQSITTYGDGAIGVQLSKPFGTIEIVGDVRTKGGQGDSLVRGKVVRLKAHAFSIKPGTRGERIAIGGLAVAENADIEDWDFETPASVVKDIEVAGHALV